MNIEAINKLPKFIEAAGSTGLWGPMPDGFSISNEDAIFVRLKDVEALVCDVPEDYIDRDLYVSVGRGGDRLEEKAKLNGWNLFSSLNGRMSDGWCGDSPHKKYYLKRGVQNATQ